MVATKNFLRGLTSVLGGVIVGMGLRTLLDGSMGDSLPFVFAIPIVFAVGWTAGLIPALATVLLSVTWAFIPGLSPMGSQQEAWHDALYFIPSGVVLGFLSSRLRPGSLETAPKSASVKDLGWLWAAIVLGGAVPLVMFLAIAVSTYQQAQTAAKARVEKLARVGQEHALKVFETNGVLIARTLDLLGDEQEDQLLSRESDLHRQLQRMAADLKQLQGIFVIGGSGRMVTTNRAYPAPHSIDFSDRPAFLHHRNGGAQPFVSEVLTSRTTQEPFFDVSVRRSYANGNFGGTVSTSLAPQYFAALYREISEDGPGLSIRLERRDGVLLAGWPSAPTLADAASPRKASSSASIPNLVSSAMAADAGDDAVTAIAEIGNFPVLIKVSISRQAVISSWYGQVVLMLALTFPAAAGLMYIGWVALRTTRQAVKVADSLRVEIANRQKIENSLRQSQKMEAVGQLTGGIAHDFNNLLQIISANLQLLRRDVKHIPSAESRLSLASEAVKRGAKLASQMLAFGRQQPLEPKVVNVGKLVLGIDDMLRRALGEAIEIETVVAGGLWNTFADRNQTENAILNLAINARDAMLGAGKLTIEASNAMLDDSYAELHSDVTKGQYVLLAISDTGSGMTPEVIARAFEPFFTTKPSGTGTGLGLSMVYGFVKQSGGHLKIYSEPGHGTTMKIYLPRSAAEEEAPELSAAPAAVGGDELILVVEDDSLVREAALSMLKELGYRTIAAADAEAALKIIEGGEVVDLLFTDVVMPGNLRSPDLAKRATQLLPRLAVLYTSGYTQNAIVHGGKLDSGVDLLTKPYTSETLAARVRTALSKRVAGSTPSLLRASAASAEKPVTVESPRPTVLVVEDDESVRRATQELLLALGHPVVATGSAEEALALVQDTAIGIVIADLGLPGMSGEVFAAQLCSQRRVGIVFATGNLAVLGDPPDGNGPVVLHKPYSSDALALALQEALKRA